MNINSQIYKNKYIKYKNKYINLQNKINLQQYGGSSSSEGSANSYVIPSSGGSANSDVIPSSDTSLDLSNMPLEYKSLPIDTGILDLSSGYEIVTPERTIEEIENIKKIRVISENLLKRRILDIPLLQEIEKIIKEKPYFKDYLIDEYYIVYNVIKRTQLIAGTLDKYELQPRHSQINVRTNNVFNLADEVINTIIKQIKIPDKKYIILSPGDSGSKIAAYILLIPEYIQELKKNNVDIILFPLSNAKRWTSENYIKYIGELLVQYTHEYEKDNVYFGIIDAISTGSTIKMINNALTNLGYKNIIKLPILDEDEDEDEDEGEYIYKYKNKNPDLGFNLLESGLIYEGAESGLGLPKCRCIPRYNMDNYLSQRIDEEDYRNQLYNCNIYLYYWYVMRDNLLATRYKLYNKQNKP